MYSRFDSNLNEFTVSNAAAVIKIQSQTMTIQTIQTEIVTVRRRSKSHKASGPDSLKGKDMKECAIQLGYVCAKMF